ncbi:hypothetical protein ACI6Q2_05265 [Chitinophagaceae bacterium LWZ2-11]
MKVNHFFTPIMASILLSAFAEKATAQQQKTLSGTMTMSSSSSMSRFSDDDNIRDEKDLKTKEVTKEVNVSKGTDIYLENSSRPIEVKTWDQPKVKLVTTIYYEGDASKLTDDEWFDKVNITIKGLGSSVIIKSGSISGSFTSYTYGVGSINSSGNSVAVFNENGQGIGTKKAKRLVTVYIPKDSKLDIESKYGDLSVTSDMGKLKIDITNGSLDLQNVGDLTLRSKYSNASLGNVKSAEIEFTNGHLTGKNIDDLDIDSKYSSVDLATVKKGIIRSTNDDYEIDEVAAIQGRKNYGNLRITKLTSSIDLDGMNADVKLRNIASSVSSIKFNNKYADLRIPVRDLKNYSVSYTGPYSSVYADFDKKPMSDEDIQKANDEIKAKSEKDAKEKISANSPARTVTKSDLRVRTVTGYTSLSRSGDIDSNFTATVGDGSGLKIDIKCQNCTVDFK